MRILVIEDEKRLVAALKRGLEAEGYSVDVALDGRTGLWMGTENSYDAVVLDIMTIAPQSEPIVDTLSVSSAGDSAVVVEGPVDGLGATLPLE